MKFTTLATIVAMSTTTALARPSIHQNHKHAHRAPLASPDYAIDTQVVYVYEGRQISAEEVQQGIANGTLVFANGAVMPKNPVTAEAAPQPSSTAAPAAPETSAAAPRPPTEAPSTPAPAEKVAEPAPVSKQSSSSASSGSSDAPSTPSGQGIERDFPDGEIDCSDFPDQYGAVALHYLGLGGWSGIQCPQVQLAHGFSDITTKKDGSCDEGDFCSYACPPGYQKTQWPSTQGATGQSVGGLLCKNGKLHLTNSALSKSLCAPGSQEVEVTVKNTMDEGASICRTDYPGTEGETVPLQSNPGTTSNLTCPDASKYYNWQGKSTSAQYYVNPKGIDSEKGCQWGSPENNWGNFAPLNLGVGYSAGAAWLSIFQNLPTTHAKLDFSIEIVGDNGGYDNLVGRCKYENGQYCSGSDSYTETSSDGKGCTVSVKSGSATFVLSS